MSDPQPDIDWALTTWEGARREQLRRWAALPLENMVAALEEMQSLATQFSVAPSRSEDRSVANKLAKAKAPTNA